MNPSTDDRQDQRRAPRYPIQLPLQFAFLGSGAVTIGFGKAVDISRDSIRFSAKSELPVAEKLVSVSLMWPVKRVDGARLKLFIWGRVLRSESHEVVVRFRRYAIRSQADWERTAGPGADWRLGSGSDRRINMEVLATPTAGTRDANAGCPFTE